MEQVRVGLVGVNIGRVMAKGLSSNERAAVVALCDLRMEPMEALATELGGAHRFFTDYREMCADPEIDAVMVATPNQLHVPVALEAVRNGKHVLVTKPLADALAPAEQLVEEAEAAGVVNMMSLSTRFDNSAQYLGKLSADGVFGSIYYGLARSVRRSGIPSWGLGFIQKGGGAFRDMGVHSLDAAWWIMGMPNPVSVSGVAGARFGPRGLGYWHYKEQSPDIAAQYAADDYATGLIRFDNGAALYVESFWASHQPEQFQIEIFGEDGGARYRPLTIYRTVNGAPTDSTVEFPKEGPTVWERIAGHWIECIVDGIPCQAPLRHGMIVQAMMEGLLQSAETGREVSIALGRKEIV